MKKKFFHLLFIAFLIISAACSNDKNNDGNESAGPDQDSESGLPDNDLDEEEPAEECGTSFGDIACDFTLPLESGNWNFEENYSKDENYLFVFYRATSASKKIWTSDFYTLFEKSPKNINYFFIVDTDDAALAKEQIQILRDAAEDARMVTGKSAVTKKMYFVEKPAAEIDSWISEWLENNSDFFFGIDRFRRIRKGGSFSEFDNLFKEAEFYDYEKKSYDLIQGETTVFKGLDKVPFAEEGWTKDILFDVDFENLSENGKLYIQLEQICESPKKCEWDRLERLFLCDEKGEKCETETGRWITTYGRSGKWLTDITPLKPLFEKDGKYKFKLTVDGDYYVNTLDFIFVKKENDQPKKLIPLFNQREQFDENYNSHFEPKILKEENIKKAEIHAFITGHGNASEDANCAEFCPFESVFTVNGHDFEIDFDKAGTGDGCFDAVIDGVVPNQYGTWPYGRAGWCPGQNVSLIKIDVTEALASGENTFSYAGYLDGEVYVPVVTNEDGYRAEIYLSSYLVIY